MLVQSISLLVGEKQGGVANLFKIGEITKINY